MGRLTIQDIATVLVEKNGLSKSEAQLFVATIFDVVQEGIRQDRLVKVKGLGTFKVIGVEARESVSVNTGERVVIDSHEKLSFTPDSLMKEIVNKPFSGFETVVLNDGVDFDDLTNQTPDSDEEQSNGEDIVDEEGVVDNGAAKSVAVEEKATLVGEEESVVIEEPDSPMAEEEEKVPVVKEEPAVDEEDSPFVGETLLNKEDSVQEDNPVMYSDCPHNHSLLFHKVHNLLHDSNNHNRHLYDESF